MDYQSHPLRNFTYLLQQIVTQHKLNTQNTQEQKLCAYVDPIKCTNLTLTQYWDTILKHQLPVDETSDPVHMIRVELATTILEKLVTAFNQGWWSRFTSSSRKEYETYTALNALQERGLFVRAAELERKADIESQKLAIASAAATSATSTTSTTQPAEHINVDDTASVAPSASGRKVSVAASESGQTLQGGKARTASEVVADDARTQITQSLYQRMSSDQQRFDLIGSLLSSSLKAKDALVGNSCTQLAIAILLSPDKALATIVKTNSKLVALTKGTARATLVSIGKTTSNPLTDDAASSVKWANILKQKMSDSQKGLPENVAMTTVHANWYLSEEFSNVMRPQFPAVADAIDKARADLLKQLATATASASAAPANGKVGSRRLSSEFFGTTAVPRTGATSSTAAAPRTDATSSTADAPSTAATTSTGADADFIGIRMDGV